MPTARRPRRKVRAVRIASMLVTSGPWQLALATAKLAAVLLCQCASMPRPTVA